MRISYVAGSMIPSLTANSIHVMKMCQAMAQEGHLVSLIVPASQHSVDNASLDLWLHYGIKKQFPIYWLPVYTKLRGYDFMVRAVMQAKKIGSKLIYTRSVNVAALAALLRASVIYEAHSLPMGISGLILFKAMLKQKGFRRLVVISHAMKRIFSEKYSRWVNEQTLLVAHDGVDLERFENLPEPSDARMGLGLEPNRFTVGYSGHLYSGRGIGLIFRLAECSPHMNFQIMGGYPHDVTNRQHQADQIGIENVRFCGFIPNSKLPLYLASCDVLLMPYQQKVAVGGGGDTSAFMSPMKLFEYMACERLIISSDLPVLREVLNEKNSILCAPDDIEQWHGALIRAESDGLWRSELAMKSREDVQKYTWRKRVQGCLTSKGLR